MLTSNLFYVFGPATEKARSEEPSLFRWTNKSCLITERSVARPRMSATEVINPVEYDGTRLLMTLNTKMQSSKFIRSEIGNQRLINANDWFFKWNNAIDDSRYKITYTGLTRAFIPSE